MLLGWRTRWWLALGAAVCLLLASWMQPGLVRARHSHRLVMRSDTTGMPPEYILTSALLGGFRSLAVQLLWIRAQSMKNDRQYYEMVDLYNIITKLQPGHHQAWAFQAWDLSYNVSVEFVDLRDRVFWLFRGIDLLRLQGIPKSDQVPELAAECAWIIMHKLGKTLDYAHPYYRQYLAAQMEDLLRTGGDAEAQRRIVAELAALPRHPADFDRAVEGFAEARARLAAVGVDLWSADGWPALRPLPQGRADAHALVQADAGAYRALGQVVAWRTAERLRGTVGMDPVKMNALNERYGALDWRVAFAHSLYWADQAYEAWWRKPDKKPDLKFERYVYFSLIDLSRAGRGVWGEDGFFHYLPDFTKIDAVVRHMDGTFRRFRDWKNPETGWTASLTGTYSGFHYFLRDALYRAWLEGRHDQAEAILRRLIVNDWQRNLEREVQDGVLTHAQAEIVKGGDYAAIAAFREVPEEYRGTAKEYFGRLIGEFLDSPTVERTQLFLESLLVSGYRLLALDRTDEYEQQKGIVDAFYKDYVLVRWPQKPPDFGDDMDNRHFVLPLADLRVNALLRLLSDDATFAVDVAADTAGRTGLSLGDGGTMALSPVLKNLLVRRLAQYEPDTFVALRRHGERMQAAAAEAAAAP